jgi:hypothetical protein
MADLFAFFHSGLSHKPGIQIGGLAAFVVLVGCGHFYGHRKAARDPAYSIRLAETHVGRYRRAMAKLYNLLVWLGLGLVALMVIKAMKV